MGDMPDLIDFAIVMLILSIPILAFTVGRPLARAWANRLTPASESSRDDIAALEHRLDVRLTRLESYVQTMAVEVERIGEANRYFLNAANTNFVAPTARAASDALPVQPPR